MKTRKRQPILRALSATAAPAPSANFVAGLGEPPDFLSAGARRYFLAVGPKLVAEWSSCIDLREIDRTFDRNNFCYACSEFDGVAWYTEQIVALYRKHTLSAKDVRSIKRFERRRAKVFAHFKRLAAILDLRPEFFQFAA